MVGANSTIRIWLIYVSLCLSDSSSLKGLVRQDGLVTWAYREERLLSWPMKLGLVVIFPSVLCSPAAASNPIGHRIMGRAM